MHGRRPSANHSLCMFASCLYNEGYKYFDVRKEEGRRSHRLSEAGVMPVCVFISPQTCLTSVHIPHADLWAYNNNGNNTLISTAPLKQGYTVLYNQGNKNRNQTMSTMKHKVKTQK